MCYLRDQNKLKFLKFNVNYLYKFRSNRLKLSYMRKLINSRRSRDNSSKLKFKRNCSITSLVRKSTNLPKQKQEYVLFFQSFNIKYTRIINAWWEFPRVFFLWLGKIKHVLCKVVWFRTGCCLLAFKQTAFRLPVLPHGTQQTA